MKFLVLLLVLLGAVAWFALGRRKSPPPGTDDTARARTPAARATPQAMVSCAHCGVHLPEADSLQDAGGGRYCSEAHRLAGPRSGG